MISPTLILVCIQLVTQLTPVTPATITKSASKAQRTNTNGYNELDIDIEDSVIEADAGHPLTELDFRRSRLLKNEDISPSDGGLSLYTASYFEGDIIGPKPGGRNAVRDLSVLWPSARIPYVLSRRYSERDRAVLAAAMQGYHEKTCIRFEPKNYTDTNFIYIYPGSGCASQVGRGGGMQFVSLGVGCVFVGIIQHELMHVAGFWHEHSRFDRDEYIEIRWDNIEPGMEYNFDKYSWDDIQDLGVKYDLGSVMHYAPTAFAKGYGPTIVPKSSSAVVMGQRKGLSDVDIEKLNRLYSCKQYIRDSNYKTRFITSSNDNPKVGGAQTV